MEKHPPVYRHDSNVHHLRPRRNLLHGSSTILTSPPMTKTTESYLPREIKLLVIHCSATRCNVPFSLDQLRQCHLQRGFTDIGYHFYITQNGEIHHGRPVSQQGAHARGFNRHSIGICYEGGLNEDGRPADTRTKAQRYALLDLLTILKYQYPEAKIVGHYQLSAAVRKACPCFNVVREYSQL